MQRNDKCAAIYEIGPNQNPNEQQEMFLSLRGHLVTPIQIVLNPVTQFSEILALACFT